LTTTLTYGPIDERGRLNAKIVYDHRVLDGAYVARRLQNLEEVLNGPIREELLDHDAGATESGCAKPAA
jgi:hypothetical protein